MLRQRVGVLHTSLALLGISLITLASIVNATGSIVPAGLITIPGASFAAVDQSGPLLTQEYGDDLELAMPAW